MSIGRTVTATVSQFHVPGHLHNRLGAGWVGWQGTWWMGALIGVFLVPAGLVVKGAKPYLVRTLQSFGVVALTALAFGVGALCVSCFTIDVPALSQWSFPDGVTGDRARLAFARVGTMHNFSYLGGFAGIVTGIVFIVLKRTRAAKALVN